MATAGSGGGRVSRDDNLDPAGDRTLPASASERSRLSRFASLLPGILFAERDRIEERLGSGGSGEFCRAFDTVAGIDVAPKVLYPRGDDEHGAVDRLRRELLIARGVGHPGVVRVHDIGEHGEQLYLVLELLTGETLRERLARAPDGGTRVVLLDFGLARSSTDVTLTATGQFLGTPEYVSPEQARGDGDVGPATDVYSTGVVHQDRFDLAAAQLEPLPWLKAEPQLAFLDALALSMGDRAALDRAAEVLRWAQDAGGSRPTIPLVALAAVIDARRGRAGPPAEALAQELERLAVDARESLVAWYFEGWANAMAARALADRGDLARAAAPRDVAARHRAAGPGLRSLLPRRDAGRTRGDAGARGFVN